jgi:hypothetical protein
MLARVDSLDWRAYAGLISICLALVWFVRSNLRALVRYRTQLDGRKPSRLARVAWALSVFSAWTGPLVVVGAVASIALGLVERRRIAAGRAVRRGSLPAQMAISNGVVLLVGTAALTGFLYASWHTS